MKNENKQALLDDWAGGIERMSTDTDGTTIMTRSDDFRTPQYLLNVFAEIEKRYRKGQQSREIQHDYDCVRGGAVVMDATVKKYDVKTKRGWSGQGVFMFSFIEDVCQFLREQDDAKTHGLA